VINCLYEASEKEAEKIMLWESGNPKREIIHFDDMASASIHVMGMPAADYSLVVSPTLSHISGGAGVDCTIKEPAKLIFQVSGLTGTFKFDTAKPDGTPSKLLNVDVVYSAGWSSQICLLRGLRSTLQNYGN